MHISDLTAFHVRILLKKRIRHASHTRKSTDTLIVRCRMNDGSEGWGEGLPRPYVTGETIQTALAQLRTTDLAGQLHGSFDGLRGAVSQCDRLELSRHPESTRDCFGNAVRSAIEISILDAAARAEGVPLAKVTELIPESIGVRQAVKRVRYSGAITPMGSIREMYRAYKLRYYGFHQCKVKVGVPGVNDVAALRRIRRVLGKDVDLRIDVNEAWTCSNVESKLQPLLRFRISSVEQPVPHADVAGLAEVRSRSTVPIMLDESLCSLSDAHRAVEQGTCDLFNIRLSKCGGFVNSVRIAAVAHRAGLGYQLGCQVGETGILSAAGRNFAASVSHIRYLEGSYDRFLVREPLTLEDITFGRGGYAPALDRPGLGVTIDDEALKRVTIAQEHWSF